MTSIRRRLCTMTCLAAVLAAASPAGALAAGGTTPTTSKGDTSKTDHQPYGGGTGRKVGG
jgi:hypothetical protein